MLVVCPTKANITSVETLAASDDLSPFGAIGSTRPISGSGILSAHGEGGISGQGREGGLMPRSSGTLRRSPHCTSERTQTSDGPDVLSCGGSYSCRSAEIGSILAARRAGSQQAIAAVRETKPIARVRSLSKRQSASSREIREPPGLQHRAKSSMRKHSCEHPRRSICRVSGEVTNRRVGVCRWLKQQAKFPDRVLVHWFLADGLK